MSTLATHYSANDIETRLLDGIRAAGLDPDQRLSVADLGAGLGGAARYDAIEVSWPGGAKTRLEGGPADRLVEIKLE